MATKYVAKLDGEIVGKRTTQNRKYTHAIVTQYIEEVCRADAYEYKADTSDRSNFDYYTQIVAAGADHQHFTYATPADVGRRLDEAAAHIEGGFDAYIARVRAAKIKRFEESLAAGNFKPFVAGWAGRPDLAQKAVAEHTGRTRRLVAIVPAEEV